MADSDFAALTLGEIVTSGKGAKTCPITKAGQPFAAIVRAMPVCFEPSAYGDEAATRVNIVFRPDEETVAWFDELDKWVVEAAARESLRFFGKAKTALQVLETYQPIVKRSLKYATQFKAKMNVTEPNITKIWDGEAQRPAPEKWTGAVVKPRIRVRGLYFMGASNFGAILEATDLQVMEEASASCPF